MIKGAIFDVDGTLLDSMFIWHNSGEMYLRSIGYEPREGINDILRPMSLYQSACYYRSEYGVTLSVEEIMEGVDNMILRYYETELMPKPGAVELLDELKAKGVKMCIATATDRPLIETALKRLNLGAYFSAVFTCTDVGHGKDEPVIYREALKHLNTDKSNTVVFEDALYALSTAKRDGFPAAAIYDRYEKRPEEMRRLADHYFTDLRERDSFWRFAEKL